MSERTKEMFQLVDMLPESEQNFISEMIPHHKGAIAMCNNLLQYNIDPRLRKVAENIIKEQSKGVEELYGLKNIILRLY